jgi:hypothetical protein
MLRDEGAQAVRRVRWPTPPFAFEGDVSVQRRCPGAQRGGVREQGVADVLDGFPAVPFQRTGLAAFPGRGWCLAKDCHGELHGLVEIVRGHRGRGGIG